MKKKIFRIGIKDFPPTHGGVEAATYNFVQATKDRYDFTIFTVWDNPTVKDNEIGGVRVFQLAKGWFARFRQIRAAVTDKKNTVLHFHMAIFIPLAIVFSLLGYQTVSSLHGLSKENKKISKPIRWLMYLIDIVGLNLVRRTVYVAKHNADDLGRFTFRKYYLIPNGSPECACINENPDRDFVFVGRISVQKNLLNLIAAADRFKLAVDIYGPIDEREVEHARKFREAISKSSFARYLGPLTSEQVYPTISRYKYFVNPSWAEASPNAVIEAGACGLLLYLSDVAGHRNVGYPDVHYFPADSIDLSPAFGEQVRSTKNIAWHREQLSMAKNLARYDELYHSF